MGVLEQARLVREHPGDPELVEDLGWSLDRMREIANERGDKTEAERLIFRRLEEALQLVRQEPENWKYLFNLSHVEYFAAGVYFARNEMDAAYEHNEESVRLARHVCELQPKRRDFLRWLAQACCAARDAAWKTGDVVAARGYGEEAWQCALEVALGDPARELHLFFVRQVGEERVATEREMVQSDPSPEVVRWMRRVAEVARRQVPDSQELVKLLAMADQLEAATSEE